MSDKEIADAMLEGMAKMREERLTARLARTVRQLQEENEHERCLEQRLDARLAESLAALEYWLSVYCWSRVAGGGPDGVIAAHAHRAEASASLHPNYAIGEAPR